MSEVITPLHLDPYIEIFEGFCNCCVVLYFLYLHINEL